MESEYEAAVELVAANPGNTVEELEKLAEESDDLDASSVSELVSKAVEEEDVVEFSGSHWVMRKGKYAFDRYDHPEP